MTVPTLTVADRVDRAIARVYAALAESGNPQTLVFNRRHACRRLELALPPLAADDTVLFYEQLRAELEQIRDRLRMPEAFADDDATREALVLKAEIASTRLVVWARMFADAHDVLATINLGY